MSVHVCACTVWLSVIGLCVCHDEVFMPALYLKYNKVPQPYLKHTGSMTKTLNMLKLHCKKFCSITYSFYVKTVGDRAVLITHLNTAWKNT